MRDKSKQFIDLKVYIKIDDNILGDTWSAMRKMNYAMGIVESTATVIDDVKALPEPEERKL